MGIFNEHSDNTFAKGIQGAPGVGFNLTSDGNYDMVNKKLRNVGAPSVNTDAATKKYVDDNSSGTPTTSRLIVDSNINMNHKSIENLYPPQNNNDATTKFYVDAKFLQVSGDNQMIGNLNMNSKKIVNVNAPTQNNDASNKKYVDDTVASNKVDVSPYVKKDGSQKMTGNIDMDSYRIYNLPTPTGPNQPTPLAFTDFKYLHVAGTNKMTNNLNMDNKGIIHLKPPTSDTDAATKKYVDDNAGSPDLSDYLEKDGSVAMTGNFNVGSNKITNLGKPTQDNDAVNKDYADKLVHHTAVQPSHYNNQFAYLMSSGSQWTDEIDSGTSFFVSRIGDLSPSKGNFHNYNHKVIFVTINKSSQGGYKYKMGINFYRLTANTEYTLCLEILNTDYQLWHKSQISVDKGTSTGLSIENVSVKKLSHRYIDAAGQAKFMYYHRIIVNFKKLSTGNKFFLHFLVNIPQEGTDLAVYPSQFVGVYLITYGIVEKISNIDPDKVYDYHIAFDIRPTEVVYNVDINTNNKKILNINLDRSNANSAATVGMVNGVENKINPFSKNYIYRKYFEDFFDFNDSNFYLLNTTSSGVVFNSLNSITGDTARNITFPTKTMDNIKDGGLNINGYTLSFTPPSKSTSYTLCIVFNHNKHKNFSLTKYDVTNINRKQQLLYLFYLNINNSLNLNIGSTRKTFSVPNDFDGKKVVLWLTESISDHVTKVNISNYSAELIANVVSHSSKQKFEFLNQDGIIEKIMYSPNFYDTGSLEHHTILLQEKLNGSYIV